MKMLFLHLHHVHYVEHSGHVYGHVHCVGHSFRFMVTACHTTTTFTGDRSKDIFESFQIPEAGF